MFTIELPPLRDRRDDIPLLVQTFLNEFNARNNKAVRGGGPGGDVSARALPLARQHPRAAQRDRARDDPRRGRFHRGRSTCRRRWSPRGEETLPTVTLSPGTTVDEAERRLILLTLEHTRNNKTRAAEILGISLKTLHNKLNRMKAETGSGSRVAS